LVVQPVTVGLFYFCIRGRCGRDRIVVGFTLMLWVRISIRAKWTTLCDKVCQ